MKNQPARLLALLTLSALLSNFFQQPPAPAPLPPSPELVEARIWHEKAKTFFAEATAATAAADSLQTDRAAAARRHLQLLETSAGAFQKSSRFFEHVGKLDSAEEMLVLAANGLQGAGHLDKSLPFLRDAAGVFARAYGADDWGLAKSFIGIAYNFLARNMRDSAEFYLQKSLANLAGGLKDPKTSEPDIRAIHNLAAHTNTALARFYAESDPPRLEKTEQHAREAVQAFAAEKKVNHFYLAAAYGILAKAKTARCDWAAALVFQDSARLNFEKYGGEQVQIPLADLLAEVGLLHEAQRQYDLAEAQYRKSIAMLRKFAGENDYGVAAGYRSLARLSARRGDHERALACLQKSLAIFRTMLSDQTLPEYLDAHFAIAQIRLAQGNLAAARTEMLAILPEIQAKIGEQSARAAAAWHFLADLDRREAKHAEAIAHSEKALEILQKNFPGDLRRPDWLGFHGKLLAEAGRPDAGRVFIEKGAALAREKFPRDWELAGNLALAHSQLDLLAGRFEAAARRAAETFSNLENNPNAQNLLLEAAKQRLAVLTSWHAKTGDPAHAEAAKKAGEQALALLAALRRSFREAGSRQGLTSANFSVFEKLIGLEISGGRAETAFLLSEKAKAQTLAESWNETAARRFAGIPESLLETERQLKGGIAGLEQAIHENRNALDPAASDALKTALFDKKQALDALIAQFEKNYPAYFNLKYNPRTASPGEIQQGLPDERAALLEFFWGDSMALVFIVGRQSVRAVRLENPGALAQKIARLRDRTTASAARLQPGRAAELDRLTAEVSRDLLSGAMAALPENCDRLLVVPDGPMAQIPLEMLFHPGKILPSQSPGVFSGPKTGYLLHDFIISYAWSAGLWLEQNRRPPADAPYRFAAFAPRYETRDTANLLAANDPYTADRTRNVLVREGQYELPGAQAEAAAVARIFSGRVFAGAAASEANFQQVAGQYRVLHFAMHALADAENPAFSRLLFSENPAPPDTALSGDNCLYSAELQGIALNADLAVLSACNTGHGPLLRGEGAMSLARAFAQAGVPATVTSLWQAPDEATRALMEAFYQNLRAGQDKAEALRQAKLAYLEGAKDGAAADPFLWAAFTATGNVRPLDMSLKGPKVWWVLLGVALTAGFVGLILSGKKIF